MTGSSNQMLTDKQIDRQTDKLTTVTLASACMLRVNNNNCMTTIPRFTARYVGIAVIHLSGFRLLFVSV